MNSLFFKDNTRDKYWKKFESLLKSKNALIFIDPDTGLETGTPSYLKKMGREKYLLNTEFSMLSRGLDSTSLLMIYQHLPKNKHNHNAAVDKKLNQAVENSDSSLAMAYREDDLAFIFLAKTTKHFAGLRQHLENYYENSGHAYKSIHFASKQS